MFKFFLIREPALHALLDFMGMPEEQQTKFFSLFELICDKTGSKEETDVFIQ